LLVALAGNMRSVLPCKDGNRQNDCYSDNGESSPWLFPAGPARRRPAGSAAESASVPVATAHNTKNLRAAGLLKHFGATRSRAG
jgi:hypothetical protein